MHEEDPVSEGSTDAPGDGAPTTGNETAPESEQDISLLETATPFLFGAVLVVVLFICMQAYKIRALHPEPGNLAAYAEKTRLVVERHHRDSPDLAGIDLHGEDLSRCDFFVDNLKGANLANANLSGAILYGSDLTSANLDGANLEGAMLDSANLTGANLAGADLRGAKFDPSTKWPVTFDFKIDRPGMRFERYPSWQTQ